CACSLRADAHARTEVESRLPMIMTDKEQRKNERSARATGCLVGLGVRVARYPPLLERLFVPGSGSGTHEQLTDNRQPGLRTVQSHVAICSEDLLIRRIEGKDFDAWVLAFEPTNDFSSGFFGSRVTDDKEAVVLNRA